MLAALPWIRTSWLAPLLAAVSPWAHGSQSGLGPTALGSSPPRGALLLSNCDLWILAGTVDLLQKLTPRLHPNCPSAFVLSLRHSTTLGVVDQEVSSPTALSWPFYSAGFLGRRDTARSTLLASRPLRSCGTSGLLSDTVSCLVSFHFLLGTSPLCASAKRGEEA